MVRRGSWDGREVVKGGLERRDVRDDGERVWAVLRKAGRSVRRERRSGGSVLSGDEEGLVGFFRGLTPPGGGFDDGFVDVVSASGTGVICTRACLMIWCFVASKR